MSATDVFRRLLTEAGMEYRTYDRNSSDTVTWFDLPDGREVCFEEYDGGTTHFRVWRETPEQAIAATLGRGTCRIKPWKMECDTGFYDCMECECGYVSDVSDWAKWNFCPNCGAKAVS